MFLCMCVIVFISSINIATHPVTEPTGITVARVNDTQSLDGRLPFPHDTITSQLQCQ